MKPFNLEEYLKNPSRKVVTRDGRNVTIHCTNYYLSSLRIIAEIEGNKVSHSFTEDGHYNGDKRESLNDLFFAPEKKEGWVNIFKVASNDNRYVEYARIFQSKEDADKEGKGYNNHITTLKIEWEE